MIKLSRNLFYEKNHKIKKLCWQNQQLIIILPLFSKMMKKRIYIFMILLAGITMATFSIIPHHHHGDSICFVNTHCEKVPDCENEPAHHHHHDDMSGCELSDRIVPQTLIQKHDCSGLCSDCCGHIALLIAILPDLQEIPVSHTFLPFRQKPFINSYLLTHVSRSLGLRAPPFC